MKTPAGLLGVYCLLGSSLMFGGTLEKEGAAIVQQGNGKGLMPCAPCHGERGEGKLNEGFPQIAGLSREYIKTQIGNFRSGARNNPVMQAVAQMMDAADTDKVAVYLENQVAQPLAGSNPVSDELGRKIATIGLWNKAVPSCYSCHGPDGLGVGTAFPRIVWQPSTYLAAQLNAWKDNTRKGDPNGLMKSIADRLSPEEIESVAKYLGSAERKQ